MLVWLVWDKGPVAVFSSEERALFFMESFHSPVRWKCHPLIINAGDSTLDGFGVPLHH